MTDEKGALTSYELAPDGLSRVAVEYGNPAYPEPFRALVDGLVRKRLGDAFGLTAFGVNLVELEPGSATSQKHWHTLQDEMIFVLDGQLRLVTEKFELDLGPGDFFGFKGGVANGHHVKNVGSAAGRLIEIGSRENGDQVTYSEVDMVWDGASKNPFRRKDGRRY